MQDNDKYTLLSRLVSVNLTREDIWIEFSKNYTGKTAELFFNKFYPIILKEAKEAAKREAGILTREQALRVLSEVAQVAEKDADRINAVKAICDIEGWKNISNDDDEDIESIELIEI